VSVVLVVEPGAHTVRGALACIPADVRDIVVVDRRGDDVLDIGIADPRPDVRLLRDGDGSHGAARALGVDAARGDIVAVVTFGPDASTAAPAAIGTLVQALRDGADYATTSLPDADVRARARALLRRLAAVMGVERFLPERRDASSSGRAFWRECVPLLGLGRTDVETDRQLDRRADDLGLRVAEVDAHAPPQAATRSSVDTSRV
jgi:hypothetical protein